MLFLLWWLRKNPWKNPLKSWDSLQYDIGLTHSLSPSCDFDFIEWAQVMKGHTSVWGEPVPLLGASIGFDFQPEEGSDELGAGSSELGSFISSFRSGSLISSQSAKVQRSAFSAYKEKKIKNEDSCVDINNNYWYHFTHTPTRPPPVPSWSSSGIR